MGGIIGMIVFGGIIGALARLIMKSKHDISVLWTIILGAIGAFIGGWLAGLLGVAQTPGIDWIRWILSIIAAIGAISVYLAATRKK